MVGFMQELAKQMWQKIKGFEGVKMGKFGVFTSTGDLPCALGRRGWPEGHLWLLSRDLHSSVAMGRDAGFAAGAEPRVCSFKPEAPFTLAYVFFLPFGLCLGLEHLSLLGDC